ncbi:MAG: hypothetical protein WA828_00050 [Coleofasciculaceae cyanobacterium]
MHSNINNTELFQFTQPELSFGQKVKTDDHYLGYIVGLDFYPETSSWAHGVHLIDRKPEITDEIWYEPQQLKVIRSKINILPNKLMYTNIDNTKLFEFSQPELSFGEKVKTEDNFFGYVVGLDFSLESKSWSYGVYLVDQHYQLIEEIWYSTEELEIVLRFNVERNFSG